MNFAVARLPTCAEREAAASGYPVIPADTKQDFATLAARVRRCSSTFAGSFCTGRQLAALEEELADIATAALAIRRSVKTVSAAIVIPAAMPPSDAPSPPTV